jgi:hypothetical protein
MNTAFEHKGRRIEIRKLKSTWTYWIPIDGGEVCSEGYESEEDALRAAKECIDAGWRGVF